MKIKRVSNKKIGDKEYFKYSIPSISEKIVKESGLLDKNLKATVTKGKIILEKE
jgi:hypothetical protein